MSIVITICAVAFLTCEQQASAQAWQPVGPGVWWQHAQTEGPLNINVMRVAVGDPRITIEAESGKDRLGAGEKTLDSVRREAEPGKTTIIGGINADFWANTPRKYTPAGGLVADGMIYHMPGKRSVFAFTRSEKPYIGPVTMKVTVSSGKQSLEVDSINGNITSPSTALFTAAIGPTLPATPGRDRYLLKLTDGEFLPNQPAKATIKRLNSDSAVALKADEVVLQTKKGAAAPWLRSANTVTLSAAIPEVDGVVTSLVGGNPTILRDGEIPSEEMSTKFAETRHPRTALGIGEDGQTLYLVTVDGRQPRISVGIVLKDLAAIMKKLGCRDAINLDGGGSTTMVVQDKVVNKFSDATGPRTVSNSLLVIAGAASGNLSSLGLNPAADSLTLPTGTTVQLGVTGRDEFGIPFTLKPGTAISVEDSPAVIEASVQGSSLTLKLSETPVTSELILRSGNAATSVVLKVVKPDVLKIEPATLVLDAGEQTQLEVRALSGGEPLLLQPEMIRLSSRTGLAKIDGLQVTGATKGAGDLQISVGNNVTGVPLFVDVASVVSLADFETVVSDIKLSGTAFSQAKSRAEVTADKPAEGKRSLKLRYSMSPGGRSQIFVPVNATVEQAPAKLALWIYGDGKEAWVRANLVDSAGARFVADFTDGSKGILWKNEWRRKSAPIDALVALDSEISPTPRYPVQVESISILQDQEVLKATGTIGFDGFSAVYPPQP